MLTNQEIARRAIVAAEAADGIEFADIGLGSQHPLALDVAGRVPGGVGHVYGLGHVGNAPPFACVEVRIGTSRIIFYGPPEIGCAVGNHPGNVAILTALRDIAAGVPAPAQPKPDEVIRSARAAYVPNLRARANHQPAAGIEVDGDAESVRKAIRVIATHVDDYTIDMSVEHDDIDGRYLADLRRSAAESVEG